MKGVDDLDKTPASVGGAMSQWPRRTVAWACRDERAAGFDPAVIESLLGSDVALLRDLEGLAAEVGIDPSNLADKRMALDSTGPEELRDALAEEYALKWGSSSDAFDTGGCPFEESGLDKACWRCPVPGRTIDRLRGEREVPVPR